jgi:hypothetical protein
VIGQERITGIGPHDLPRQRVELGRGRAHGVEHLLAEVVGRLQLVLVGRERQAREEPRQIPADPLPGSVGVVALEQRREIGELPRRPLGAARPQAVLRLGAQVGTLLEGEALVGVHLAQQP